MVSSQPKHLLVLRLDKPHHFSLLFYPCNHQCPSNNTKGSFFLHLTDNTGMKSLGGHGAIDKLGDFPANITEYGKII
jgi:hypothetical protein